tara:strand:+ start:4603 stop:4875 length:273 start_codon:yes stop_codon:yes gene_type:complete
MRESDYRTKLIDYLKKNLKKNYTEESLKWALINQGYSRTDVMGSIEQANKELAEEVPVLKEKPVIKHQIIDEYDNPILIKKPFWKRILGL